MNENITPLLGTPVNVTVFMVTYEYKKPKRKSKLPGSAKKDDDVVQNRVPIVSGDPSGADAYSITKRLVLGVSPYEGHDFRVLFLQRLVDAMGLATPTTWDKLDGQAPVNAEIPTVLDDDDEGESGSDPTLN